jgi:hypothetical protein
MRSDPSADVLQAHDQARALIVYACPLGELANQIEQYFAASLAICGPNAAHAYMPHCTLTGFFHDDAAAIASYIKALDAALRRARPDQPAQALSIDRMELSQNFHGLLLRGSWLKGVISDFASAAHSPTRRDALRLKDWLHLSLAYNFPPEHHEPLAKLAREYVDIRTPVAWDLRFYERHGDGSWACHASWPL